MLKCWLDSYFVGLRAGFASCDPFRFSTTMRKSCSYTTPALSIRSTRLEVLVYSSSVLPSVVFPVQSGETLPFRLSFDVFEEMVVVIFADPEGTSFSVLSSEA